MIQKVIHYVRYRMYIEDITFVSIIFPERERGKYHNLGTSVVNIECNIMFINVELLNKANIQTYYIMFTN